MGGRVAVDMVMLVTLITGPLTGEASTAVRTKFHMLGDVIEGQLTGVCRYINSVTNSASSHPIHITVQNPLSTLPLSCSSAFRSMMSWIMWPDLIIIFRFARAVTNLKCLGRQQLYQD